MTAEGRVPSQHPGFTWTKPDGAGLVVPPHAASNCTTPSGCESASGRTMPSDEGTLNVDTGGSSAGQSAVCGTSDASDQPAEIGGRRFESDPPVSAQASGRVSS